MEAGMDMETRIRNRAYAIWQEEGRPDGKADEHWEKARRFVEEEDARGSAGNGTKKPVVRKAPRRRKKPSPAEAGENAAVTNVLVKPKE
jgi:hypothetical protein